MIGDCKKSSNKILAIVFYFLCFMIFVTFVLIKIDSSVTIDSFANFIMMRNTREYKREIVNGIHPKCDPKTKIGFLKTHKCASTTMQNILLRYGRANKLNFVLSAKGPHLNQNVPFKRSMIRETLWEKAGLEYDMFLLHSIWNHNEIANTLSDHGDAFYFSTIRNPVELFRSFWDYISLDRKYNKSIEEYALSAVKDTNTTLQKRPFGFNQILHDFGLPYKDMNNRKKIYDKIKEIDEMFDLILIADKEYINDSIILLKDALCWEYQDMISFQLNSKNEKLVTPMSARAYQALKGSKRSIIM